MAEAKLFPARRSAGGIASVGLMLALAAVLATKIASQPDSAPAKVETEPSQRQEASAEANAVQPLMALASVALPAPPTPAAAQAPKIAAARTEPTPDSDPAAPPPRRALEAAPSEEPAHPAPKAASATPEPPVAALEAPAEAPRPALPSHPATKPTQAPPDPPAEPKRPALTASAGTPRQPAAQPPPNAAAEPATPRLEPQPARAAGAPSTVPQSRPAEVETTIADGRALLRIFEHGEGPSIEIAWPANRDERQRLFDLLSRCFGMQVAVTDGTAAIHTIDPATHRVAALDLDRLSGFVRVIQGEPLPGELRAIEQVGARFGAGGNAVRIFPRRFDALLLGGLSRIAGPSYRKGSAIRARYALDGGRVVVTSVSVDGRLQAGGIDLTPASRCT